MVTKANRQQKQILGYKDSNSFMAKYEKKKQEKDIL